MALNNCQCNRVMQTTRQFQFFTSYRLYNLSVNIFIYIFIYLFVYIYAYMYLYVEYLILNTCCLEHEIAIMQTLVTMAISRCPSQQDRVRSLETVINVVRLQREAAGGRWTMASENTGVTPSCVISKEDMVTQYAFVTSSLISLSSNKIYFNKHY